MDSTRLKNINQFGNLPQIGVNIKNDWNHHLDSLDSIKLNHAKNPFDTLKYKWFQLYHHTKKYILYINMITLPGPHMTNMNMFLTIEINAAKQIRTKGPPEFVFFICFLHPWIVTVSAFRLCIPPKTCQINHFKTASVVPLFFSRLSGVRLSRSSCSSLWSFKKFSWRSQP